jgi:hypothetical protein
VRNIAGGAGSGSDVDTGAGSGAELTEGGKIKKLKLNPSVSRGGTPQGSRAASPLPRLSGSRANSPDGPRGEFRSKYGCDTRSKLTIYRPPCVDSNLWNPDVPDGRRNPCSHPGIWHPQQRPLEVFRPRIGDPRRTTGDSLPLSRMSVSTEKRIGCCDQVPGRGTKVCTR